MSDDRVERLKQIRKKGMDNLDGDDARFMLPLRVPLFFPCDVDGNVLEIGDHVRGADNEKFIGTVQKYDSPNSQVLVQLSKHDNRYWIMPRLLRKVMKADDSISRPETLTLP